MIQTGKVTKQYYARVYGVLERYVRFVRCIVRCIVDGELSSRRKDGPFLIDSPIWVDKTGRLPCRVDHELGKPSSTVVEYIADDGITSLVQCTRVTRALASQDRSVVNSTVGGRM